jgi:TolB-like protein
MESSKPVYVKNGKVYGEVEGAFRHRWWNYYERGLSYAEGEFYDEATEDLKESIRQRSNDQRMARTYGMHFMDYFPHRELGIVYYYTNNMKVAEKELELSLSHFPSAKARFYLDRVRRALIEKEGEAVSPPILALDSNNEEIWSRGDPMVISGVAEDEHYISQITINRTPLFLEGSQKRVPFKEILSLSQGRHVLEVAAENLLGKSTRRRVIIHVDREGPIITLEDLGVDQSASGKSLTIHGTVFDEAGVSDLSINGESIPGLKGVDFSFTKTLPIKEGHLELVARDRLGNRTSATIPITAGSVKRTPLRLASANSNKTPLFVGQLFGPKDTTPPSIKLKGFTTSQKVFLEKVFIEGEIRDENQIEELTMNHHSILRHRGECIFFSHMADLEEGENQILLEARDEAGNTATKRISIIRIIPKALQLEERLSLTVLPFEQKGVVSAASLSFQDNLIDGLVDQNRFQVVERERLDVVLEEQKLSRTKLIDSSTALRLGRLAAAQSIITGSMIETRTGIEIVGRMIDTETSEILATQDVYSEEKDLPALRDLAEGMAVKFHRDFPLLDGHVVQIKGENVFTDLGQDKIKLNRRLILYREDPIKDPATGKVFGADNVIIGRARVIQVMPEMSKAEIVDGPEDSIKRLDKVITE